MDTETQGWEWLLLPPNRCGDGGQKGTGKISPGIVSLRLMFPWLKKSWKILGMSQWEESELSVLIKWDLRETRTMNSSHSLLQDAKNILTLLGA